MARAARSVCADVSGRIGIDFPVERETAARLAGMRADKIRFFAHAYSVPSPADLNRLLTDRSYNGDLLFVSLPGEPRSRR